MVQVQTVDVSHGVAWIGRGWRTFVRSPGMWAVLSVAFLAIVLLLSHFAFLGDLIISFVSPALIAGLLFAAQEVEAGRPIQAAHFVRGFQESSVVNGLLGLGGIAVAGTLAGWAIAFFFLGDEHATGLYGGDPKAAVLALSAPNGMLVALLTLALNLLVLMAMTYAVPLVMFRRTSTTEAMRASVYACVRNVLPLIVFGALYLLLSLVVSMPVMTGFVPVLSVIGWLALFPASIGMLYASYRDCFAG